MDGPGFFIADLSWLESIIASIAVTGIIICVIAAADELFTSIRNKRKRRNDRNDPDGHS